MSDYRSSGAVACAFGAVVAFVFLHSIVLGLVFVAGGTWLVYLADR